MSVTNGENGQRKLTKRIIEFVKTWDEVRNIKIKEDIQTDPIKKEKLLTKSRERLSIEAEGKENQNIGNLYRLNGVFTYIYTWISGTADGELEPHCASTRDRTGNFKSKRRDNQHPIEADIVDYLWDCPSGKYSDPNTLQITVHNILKELVEKGKIRKEANEYKPKPEDESLTAKSIAALATLKEDCFLSVSRNTYIIAFNVETLPEGIVEFFKNYCKGKYFDIYTYKNKVYIHLKGNRDACTAVGIDLRTAVRSAYLIQKEIRESKYKKR